MRMRRFCQAESFSNQDREVCSLEPRAIAGDATPASGLLPGLLDARQSSVRRRGEMMTLQRMGYIGGSSSRKARRGGQALRVVRAQLLM